MPHKKGRPVVIVGGMHPMEASTFDCELMLRGSYMVQDLTHLKLGPVPEGYVFVMDMLNWGLGHVMRCPLPICSAALKYAQEGSCCKIAGIHFMNGGPVLERFLSILKPFINPDVWKILHVHEKTAGLTQFLESYEIPKDYDGGCGPSLAEITEQSYKTMKEYKDWFDQEVKLRVEEEKRPAGSKPLLDDGIQGSFRKLDID